MAAPRAHDLPSYERVRGLFDYDADTGILSKSGKPVGWGRNQNHYLKVDIDGGKYFVHRVIVLWMTGEWPLDHVDHIDLDIFNNRWANLRQCTKTQNQGNRTKRVDNSSGVKGVHWDASRGRWLAQISKNQRHIFIGRFDSIDEARAAYAAKAVELYGEFARVA